MLKPKLRNWIAKNITPLDDPRLRDEERKYLIRRRAERLAEYARHMNLHDELMAEVNGINLDLPGYVAQLHTNCSNQAA